MVRLFICICTIPANTHTHTHTHAHIVMTLTLLHHMFGTLPPLATLINAIIYLTIIDRLLSVKVIQIKDEYTGRVKRWNIGTWINLPSGLRFDAKVRFQYRKTILTTMILWFLFTSYPILSAVFNEQSVVVQAIMVPIFFGFRGLYEYVVVMTTGKTFGSDSLTVTTFAGTSFSYIDLFTQSFQPSFYVNFY